MLAQLPNEDIKLWFAGSGAEDISRFTRQIEQSLQNQSSKNLTWTYSEEPDEKHNTIFRATKERALIWTLNKIKLRLDSLPLFKVLLQPLKSLFYIEPFV